MENQRKSAREILQDYRGPQIRIMEVCGTHTHEIFRLGIRRSEERRVGKECRL